MAPNENDDTWKSLVAMIAKETDAERLSKRLSKLAAEFMRRVSDKTRKSA
jgi:hypothetical protein